ncbi:unnamed protein product [Oreochromis niloticus]|nr:unnamed protein product [Mustela putorius furo]
MGTKRPSWTLFDTLTNTSRSDHKLQPGGKIPLDPSPRLAMADRFKRELERRAKKGDTFPRMKKGLTSPDRRLMPGTEMDEERGERRWNDRPPKKAETDVWDQERQRTFQVEKERYEVRGRGKEEGKPTGRRYIEDEKLRQRGRYQELSDIRFQDSRREVDDSWDRRERQREKPRPDMHEREVRMGSPHRRKDRENYADRKENENARRREKRRDIRSEGDDDERGTRRERGRDREREELIIQYSRSEGDNMGKMANDRDREMQRYRDRNRDKERRKETDRQGREGGRDLREDRWDRREYESERDRKRKEKEAGTRMVDTTGRSSRLPNEWAPSPPARTHSSGEWSSDPDSEKRHRRNRDRYDERESRRDSSFEKKRERETWRDQDRTADKSQREVRNERHESDKGEKTGSVPELRRMWLEPQRGKNSTDKFEDSKRHTGRKELRGEGDMSMDSQTERGRDGRPVKEEPDCERRQGGRNECREDAQRQQEGVSADEENVGEIRRGKRGKEHLSDSDAGVEESWQRDEQGDNVIDDRDDENGCNYWPPSESEGGSEVGWKKERDDMPSTEDGFVTVSSGEENSEEGFRDCQEFQEGGTQAPAGFQGFVGDQKREEERTMGEVETADGEDQGEEKQPKYLFCVVGQTLPRSKPSNILPLQVDQIGGVERSDPNLETHHELVDDITQQPQNDSLRRLCRNDEHPMINNRDTGSEHKVQREERLSTEEATESNIHSIAPSEVHNLKYGKEMRSKGKQSYSEMGRKDSKTDRLLKEWREKNKGPTDKKEMQSPISQSERDQLQPIFDRINTTGMSPEEVEALRIRLSGAWSVSEEPKRHSQAPHLKWAKNVVREILGHSEEEPSTEAQEEQPAANQTETSNAKPQEEVAEETREVPAIKLRMDDDDLEPELEELFDARGMGQSQAHMHADQFTAMHVVTHTHTHADTALKSEKKEDCSMDKTTLESSGEVQLGKSDIKVTVSETEDEFNLKESEKEELREKEAEMYLSANNTLYKPNSCPILYHDCESELLCPSSEGESQGVDYGRDESEEERQGKEPEDRANAVEVIVPELTEVNSVEAGVEAEGKVGNLESSYSSRKPGSKVPSRRKGVRKTTQRRNVDVEEDEGVGRDRRTRVFYATDDEDERSKSLGEVGLRSIFGTIERQKSNSRFYNAAQLYQQYSEAAQNFEILRQARSEFLSVSEDHTSSPLPSPPPARRALPPIPPQTHAQSFSHTGSVSIQSLPLPERPKGERRASSPRLSISQSSSLWRDLPGVRNSAELDELTEDQRRLQEVRFEVITSEASYCRSLEIVVDHFVKSKQLGAQLSTQDKNWLFSRLVDVRAISHSFLSKLEERVESDVMHFTVCDIIYRQCPLFRKAYVPYLTNQSYQDATYQRLMNENPRFKMIVEKIEKSAVCQRLPLRSFLVLPFQRITRLKLLVQNIVKRTTRGTAEATQAIKALKQLENIIQEGNDSISQMKSIESLVSLSAKVDFECKTLPLISQSRRMVREGPVTQLMDFSLKETERNAYLHLFNDYLLLSLPKEGGRFTVIDHCPVSELRVENCRVKLHSLQKNLFRLYMAQKSLLLRTDAPSDKLRWISALSRPHTEVDFSSAQDFEQMQCIRAFFAQQPDELSLEKADVILVHQESSDNWVEGTKLSDRQRGWVPKSHLETIASSRIKNHNLSDALKLTAATATA